MDEISTNPISWLTAVAVLILLGTFIVLSYGLVQSKMIQSIQMTKQKVQEIKESNSLLLKDIQIRHETEIQLRKSEALLLEAHRIAKLGNWEIYFLTGEFKMADICYAIMGVSNKIPANRLLGGIICQIHRDDVSDFKRIIHAAIKNDEIFAYNFRVINGANETRHMASRGKPVINDSGKVIGYAGIIQDITTLKKSEEELMYLNEELDQIVKKRTEELELKYSELEQLNRVFVGRELRMVELKETIVELKSVNNR